MLIFLGQLSLLMCMSKSNCDEELYKGLVKASCTSKCLTTNLNMNFNECFDHCEPQKSAREHFTRLKEINENHDLSLICRDDRSLTLNDTAISSKDRLRQPIKEIYLVGVSEARATEMLMYLSDDDLITIENLRPNTTYNISLAVAYSSDKYSIVAKGKQYETLRRGYKPKDISGINVVKFEADEIDDMRLNALISWSPSSDRTCYYVIICFSLKRMDMDEIPIDIRDPQYSYINLTNLTLDTGYNVSIRAMNIHDLSKESALVSKIFKTPSCVELYGYNFNICKPLQPEGLSANEQLLDSNKFSLNISWEQPKYEPDYYTIRILTSNNKESYVGNASRVQTWHFIPNITLNGMEYRIQLIIHILGKSTNATIPLYIKAHLLETDKSHITKVSMTLISPIFCIVIFSMVRFIICHRRAKLKRYQERCQYFEDLERKAPMDPKSAFDFPSKILTNNSSQDDLQFQLDLEEKLCFNDHMEIKKSDVVLHEVIGEGAFGVVRRGLYHKDKPTACGAGYVSDATVEVAVKMLKDHPSVDDVRAFRREIEVMKSVGHHPNIVGIIGHYTMKFKDMLLLTEYCSFGSLLNFLRNEWKFLHDISVVTVSSRPPLELKNQRNLNEKMLKLESTKPTGLKCSDQTNGKKFTTYINDSLPKTHKIQSFNPTSKLQPTAKFNESYGYDDFCTNACKYQVEICNGVSQQSGSHTGANISCKPIRINNDCECRSKRFKQVSANKERYYKNIQGFATNVTGKTDSKLETILSNREPLKTTDLIDIARQVALGMEFLSKNKVVHRDLAARNILVSSDRSVKIADFGLSRDVYQENIYKKTGRGKLPIKWLAIESMTHQVYTTQSDVWSYGILLYEIATLGGIPYPSTPTSRLLQVLKSGYRMEQPRSCGPEFYKLMRSCWRNNPADRPTFTNIINVLDQFLISDTLEIQIEKVVIIPTNTPGTPEDFGSPTSPKSPTSDDSYLKPLK